MAKNYTYVPGAEFPYQYRYEHMAVTTDCVIFTYEDRQLKVLLIRRGADPYKGQWAFPGGFLRINESAQEGALRELREETALQPAAIEQLGVFSDVDRDPRERVITIAWYALVKPSEVTGGDDADEAAWFPVDNLPPLAFDHGRILREAMERLRRDIHFQPVGFDLLDETFSIPDLQALYEAILGRSFDRRNFQRKMLASGILDEVRPEREDTFAVLNEDTPEPYARKKCSEERVFESVPLMPCDDQAELETGDPMKKAGRKKGRQGRTPSLWSLNTLNYKKMKEEDGSEF
jgi:8-oxo-dGTP diphosphatase